MRATRQPANRIKAFSSDLLGENADLDSEQNPAGAVWRYIVASLMAKSFEW